MSLTNCHTCGYTVARSAKTCPSCGVYKPARTRLEARTHDVANALMALGLLIMILVGLGSCLLGLGS